MQLGRLNPDFEDFVRARSGALLRTAVLLTGDQHLAEDLLQQALWKVARRWSAARDAPDAYARAALATLAVDRWRSRRLRPPESPYELERHDFPVEHHADQLVNRDALLRALRGLPRQQRVVIVLRYFEDLSVEETAAALHISSGAVKSATSRGLAALRTVIVTHERQEQSC